MTRALTESVLPSLRARGVHTPNYDIRTVSCGIVHFGPGAFHRVHQAWYVDALLEHDSRWGICEVALQTAGVRDALAPQDGLYTLCSLDEEIRYQVIGSTREFLVARQESAKVLNRIAAPTTHLISATVTEKGYCLAQHGGLDFNHEDVRRDLAARDRPVTFIGYLVEGLRRRREAKLPPPNVVSCDNLTDNGHRLRRAVLEFAGSFDRTLERWIEQEVSFPCTMVDSITPATDDALRNRVEAQLSVADRWPVQREAFSQWVIEDSLRGVQPDFARVGVDLTNDVRGYEQAKLRLLNGSHSALAYVGLLAGFELVSAAVTHPRLGIFVDALMQDIMPTVHAPARFDLDRYAASLVKRFKNPALPHRLAQIAWDGSQKIPYRLLGTMRDALAAGRSIDRLCVPIAAWLQFLRRRAHVGDLPVDPLAKELCDIGSKCDGTADDIRNWLSLRQLFPDDLVRSDNFVRGLTNAYVRLDTLHDPKDLEHSLGVV